MSPHFTAKEIQPGGVIWSSHCFPSLLAPQQARNWPSFINDRTRAYLEPSLTSLTCTASISSLLPTSQAVQAHRQSLTNSACAQACPTGLFRAHTLRNPPAGPKTGCLTSAKSKYHLTPSCGCSHNQESSQIQPFHIRTCLVWELGKTGLPFQSSTTPHPCTLPSIH